jgi:hypothetical protein
MTLQEVFKSVDDLSNKKILINSLRGFAAQSRLSSDDFARSKQDEIILENRNS